MAVAGCEPRSVLSSWALVDGTAVWILVAALFAATVIVHRTQPPRLESAPTDLLKALVHELGWSTARRTRGNRIELEHLGYSVLLTWDGDTGLDLAIDTRGRLPRWLRIAPRRSDAQVAGRAPEGVIETHDPFLDRAFWVAGPPRALAARLTHPVRLGLLDLRNVTVEPGLLTSRCRASRLAHLVRWVERVFELADALAAPVDDLDEALLRVLREDPVAPYRLRVLALFQQPEVDEERRVEALSVALNDSDFKVRCFAALRVEAPLAIIELKGLAGGYEVPEDVRLAAFFGLLKRTKGSELVALFIPAAAGPDSPLSRKAMAWAVAYGGDAALKEIVARPRLPLSGLASAVEMARRRNATVVGPELLAMLKWAGISDARRAVALDGLRSVGTVGMIPTLKRIAENAAPPIAEAAKHAIAEIQSRSDDSAGALSLAESDRGQLAVVEGGDLGVVDEG